MASLFFRSGRNSIALALLAVVLLGTTLVLGPSQLADAQGVVPFDCDGTPYIMQNSRMYQIVPDPANPGMFLFEEIGQAGISYGNSLGYDPTTNLVYGVKKVAGAWTVITYDGTWSEVNSQTLVEAPGSPTYPSNGSNYAGTVMGDGSYMVATYNAAVPGSTSHNLWNVDAATGEATWIGPISPQSPSLADFAYNPLDGYMYHVAQGNLHRLDPLTGAKVNMGAVAGAATGYGSSYFDAAGNLYVHKNSTGDLLKVSGIDTGVYTSELVATTPRVSGADAASCVGEIDLLKDVVDDAGDPVALDDRIYAPGDIVRYEFTIVNNALPAGPQPLQLCDTLPADGRSYTGTVVTAAAFSFTPPLTPGDTSFCADVTVPSSLWADPASPGGDPVTVIIEVELDANMLPGDYDNQATLESPFDPGDFVFSDDPGDVSDPEDPTTIQVTGEFSVSKAVETHPDGNDTDTFTIVVECVDADDVAFDVEPESIVDSAGDPWTGAAVNTFPIIDGETARVIDLPAGATCTAVESPVPAAYSLTPTSSDEPFDDGGELVIDERPDEEFVELVNRTGQFSLTKGVRGPAASAAPLDLNGTFPISVECTLAGVTIFGPTTFNVVVTDGVSATLGYPDLPLLPHKSECVATEIVPAGWVGSPPVTFFIIEGEPANATFKNTRLVAPLTVTKTITGLPDTDDPNAYDFEVTITCSGGFANPTETFGPFTLRTDLDVLLENLPVTTSCTVTETPVQAFAPTYSPAGGVTSIEEAGSQVDIDNITGTFVVRKDTLVSTDLYDVLPGDTFTFTIVCESGGVEIHNASHTIDATNPAPGGATGGLTYEDDSLPLLPPGTTCVITEDPVTTGWQLTSPNGITIEIPADGERPTAVFTNTRILGDLVVEKEVTGLPDGVDPNSFTFPITLSCDGPFTAAFVVNGEITHDGDFTLPALPVGTTCVVTETPGTPFVSTVAPAGGKTKIDDDGGATVSFTNETTWFSVTKNTSIPAGHPIEDDATFEFTIVCRKDGVEVYNATASITTSAGTGALATADIPLLPEGSECRVTETALAGWQVDASPQEWTTSDTPGELTFTNTREVGALEVTKEIAGLPDGAAEADYDFLVDIVCTGDFDSTETPPTTYTISGVDLSTAQDVLIESLPTGAECVITEQTANGFVASYPDGQTGEIALGIETLSVLNTTSSFSISKTTTAPDGVIDDATFNFSWVCDDVNTTSGSTSLTTVGGSAATTFAGNSLPLLPPGTTCTVTEAVTTGWSAASTSIDVTTNATGVEDAAFVNSRDVGSLIIEKSIVGLPSGADVSDFTFEVTVTCTGDFDSSPLTVVESFQSGEQIIVNDLPTGADCNVDETDDPAWTPLYDPVGGDLTIVEGDNDMSIVNSTGELIVFKENFVASTHPIDPIESFDFEISCSFGGTVVFGPSIFTLDADTVTPTGSVGGIAYADLGASFAPGTVCTVTEQTPPAGWTIREDLFPNPAEVTITSDGGATALFANERLVSELTVVKEVVGLPDGVDASSFDFEVSVVCNHPDLPVDYNVPPSPAALPIVVSQGNDVVLQDLPTGAICEVDETADPRFAPTLPADVTIDEDGETATIINTTRTLSITKTTVTPGGLPVDLADSFSFDIECDNGFTATRTTTTDANGNATIAYPSIGLFAAGTLCTVTENGPSAQWGLTTPNDVVVDLTTDGSASFTNTRKVGELKITKTIVGLPASAPEPSFTVDVVCSGEFASSESPPTQHTFSNVPLTTAGTTLADIPTDSSCVVSEDPTNAYTPSYPAGTTVVIADTPGTVEIVNETSTFNIVKTTVTPAGVSDDALFEFTWSCNDPALSSGTGSITGAGTLTYDDGLPLVPVGTECTVTEPTPPVGWTVSGSPAEITTATGGPVDAEIENTRTTTSLTITKAIEGFPADFPNLDDELFTVTVTCTGGFDPSPATFPGSISVNASAQIDDLPTGATCSVVEDPDPEHRFFAIYSPASLELGADPADNELGVINVTGELMVQKNTIVPSTHPISPVDDFDVRIICSDTTGEFFNEVRTVSIDMVNGSTGTGGISYDTLPLFADGSTCTVEEVNIPAGWTETTDPAPGTLTIDSEAPVTAVLENTRLVGDLTVTKSIEGLPDGVAADSFTFTVTVTCNGGGLPADYEIGPFPLVAGEDVLIEDLPTGASCVAEEAADPRFTPTYPTDAVEIAVGDQTLPLINTTTFFSITKTATADSLLPVDLAEDFTFTITCGSEPAVQITISTANNGLGSADHTDGLPLVPPGTLCTVTEVPRTNWTETSSIVPFTTEVDVSPQLAFTNERDVAEFTVDKSILGLPASVDPDTFEFAVSIECTGGFSTPLDNYELTDQVLSTADDGSLVVAGVPIGATCSATENLVAPSPFANSYSPSSAVTIDGDETITVINETSTFEILKTTVTPPSGEDDATFTFTWSCDDAAASSGTTTFTTVDGTGTFSYDTDPTNLLPLVPPGTSCVVTETVLPAGWEVDNVSETVTTLVTGPATAAFVNTRVVADLVLSKAILGLSDTDPDADTFVFDVVVTCTGDFPGGTAVFNETVSTASDTTIPNLPTGAECTVVEDSTDAFAAVYGPSNADGTAGVTTVGDAGGGIAITNLTGRVAWVKQTIVPVDHPVNAVDTFEFDVVCTTADGLTELFRDKVFITTSTLTAAGAVGIPNEADFPLLAAGSLCSITEVGPGGGWTLTSTPNPVDVVISPTPNPGVFENTRDTATLTINKIVEGHPVPTVANDLEFTVTVVCDHPDLTPSTGYTLGPLLVSAADPIQIANLPTGAACTATEASDAAYQTTYENQDTVIADGETTTITNSTGVFTLNKQVTSANPNLLDPEQEFMFSVVCDGGFNEIVDVETDFDGFASIGYPTIPLVPEGGTCTVSEHETPAIWDVSPAGSVEVTIVDGVAVADFTNTRKTADLVVTKVIAGAPAGVNLDNELFDIAVECLGDVEQGFIYDEGTVSVSTQYVLADIPTGAICSVSESGDPRFSTSYDPDPATVEILAETGGAVEITNSTGELIVAKETVIPEGSELDPTGTFRYDIRCVNPATGTTVYSGQQDLVVTMADATATGASGGIRYDQLPLMPDGTECTITEINIPSEWELTSDNEQVVTISSSDPMTAEFVNKRDVATLQITKEIDGLPNGVESDFDDELFTIVVTCDGDFVDAPYEFTGTVSVSTPLDVPNLPTGATCEIVETNDSRFTASYDPQNVLIGDSGASSIITNTTGELIVMKEASAPSTHPIDAIATFEFELVCTTPGASAPLDPIIIEVTPTTTTASGAIGGVRYDELPLFADGTTCVITETNVPADWTLASPNGVPITINSEAPVTAPFVNTHDVGSLAITKETFGLPPEIAASSLTFGVTATCNHRTLPVDYQVAFQIAGDGTHTISDLPANAVCSIAEVPDPDVQYAVSYSPSPADVTIVKDDTVTVDITNDTSYFSIRKIGVAAGSEPINLAATFTFDVVCANGFTGQVDIATDATGVGTASHLDGLPLLPPDATCTISEPGGDLPSGWIFESPIDGTLSLDAGEADRGELTFTNRRQAAALTVTKTIEGLPGSIPITTPTFPVTVTCNGDFENGTEQVYTGTISVGGDITIDDLPTDATCSVVEAPDAAYATTTDPSSGSVDVAVTGTTVEIINATATFAITKQTTVSSPLPVDIDTTFTFDYECADPSGSVIATGSTAVTTSGGAGAVGFDSAAPNNLPMLPHGTTCTVTERPLTDWTPTSSAELTLTLDSDEVTSFDFENSRDVAVLTVDKDIVGLPASQDPDSFTFTVDITCTGDFDGGSYTTTETLSTDPAAGAVVIPGVPVGSTCSVVETLPPTSPFVVSYEPASGELEVEPDSLITVTNTTSTFEITKTTTAPGYAEDDAVFTFNWTCNDPLASTGSATIETTDGTGAFTFDTDPANPLPLVAPGTICTVYETDLPAGWTVAASPQVAITSGSSTEAAAFQNTRDVADLVISKTILGLAASDPDADSFTFTVDIVCTGDFPGGTLTLTETLSTADNTVVSNLPTGAVCTVTEQTPPGFEFAPVYGPANPTGTAAVATITDEGAGIAITNLTGRVAWVKQTIIPFDHPVTPVGTFDFLVTCTDATGANELFSDTVSITTDTITAAGAVGIPNEVDFPLLPAGSLCTITELGPGTGWSLTSTPNPVNVVISPEPNPGVFENTRDTATLTISKVVEGHPDALAASQTQFEVTILCSHPDLTPAIDYTVGPLLVSAATPLQIANLPTGAECTTQETADPAYDTLYTNQTTEIQAGASTTITNRTGVVTINKQATASDPALVNLSQTFDFQVVCDGGFDETVQVATNATGLGSTTYPAIGLVPEGGTCTITEQATPSTWAVSPAGSIDVTVIDGVAVASFTNTRDTASLVVTKVVDGAPANVDLTNELFALTVACTGDFPGGTYSPTGSTVSVNSQYELENLPTGAICTVAEVADPRFSVTYSPDPASVEVLTGSGASVEITNSTGELIVSKQTVIPAGRSIDPQGVFTYQITCVDPVDDSVLYDAQHDLTVGLDEATDTGATGGIGYSELPLLPNGTECTVTEVDIPDEWALASENDQVVTISSSNPATAKFTNTRDVATLTIKKLIDGLPASAVGQFDDELFTVTISCTGDFLVSPYEFTGTVSVNVDLEITNLPTNAECAIAETQDPRFTPSYAPQVVTIGDTGAASTITNISGELIVAKDTVVASEHPITAVADFEFLLVCTSPGATSALDTIEFTLTTSSPTADGAFGGIRYDDLPLFADGTTCVVSETNVPADWTLTSPNDVPITIDSSEPVTASFVNTHDLGDLEISKTTVGLPDGIDAADLLFELTATCNHQSLPTDYTVTFELSGSDSHTIAALPANATCVIAETPDAAYGATYSPSAIVTIVKDDTVAVDVTNTTSYFSITKTGVAPGDEPINLAASFNFDVTCTNGFSQVFVIATNAAGVGTASYLDGLPLTPPDVTCDVAEVTSNLPAGWLLQDPASGLLTTTSGSGETDNLNFVNRRDAAALTIIKSIEGLPASIDPTTQTFPVTITCQGDFAGGSTQLFEQSIAVGNDIIIEDLPTDASCSVIESSTLAYSVTTTPASGSVTVGEAGASVGLLNSTATFEIAKSTSAASMLPVVIDATFVFDYVCTEPGGAVLAAGTTSVTTVDGVGSSTFDSPAPNGLPMLPPGTSCTVTEQPLTNWTTTSPAEQTLVLAADEVQTFDFDNQRDVATLAVAKNIVGLPSSLVADDYSFNVDVVCTGDFTDGTYATSFTLSTDQSVEIAGVPVGASCAATENLPADSPFMTSYAPESGVIAVSGDRTLVITNSTSTFAINKTTVAGGYAEGDAEFSFAWTCDDAAGSVGSTDIVTTNDSGEFTFTSDPANPLPLVPPGSRCFVTETDLPPGWTVEASPLLVTTSATETVTADFVNTRTTADLTISKSILGLIDSDPAADTYSFDIDIVCAGDFPGGELTLTETLRTNADVVIEDLPTGAQCVVTEQTPPGFEFAPVYGPATADGNAAVVTITEAGAGVAIINLTGRVAWVKQTIVPVDHPINPVATFDFAVACAAPDGTLFEQTVSVTTDLVTAAGAVGIPSEADFPLQPAGSECTITEVGPGDGWTLTSASNPVSVTISPEPNPGVFENTRDAADLTIAKVVQGLPEGLNADTFDFSVTLTCAHPDLPTDYQIGPLVLATDTDAAVANLPTGTSCVLDEGVDPRFTATYLDETITVSEDTETTIVNSAATFAIDKQTIVESDYPVAPDGTFKFSYTCTSASDQSTSSGSTSITTTDGSGQATFVAGATDGLPIIAAGSICVVSEEPLAGWDTVSAGEVTLTLEALDVATAEFTNSRNLTALEITKTLEGLPDGVDAGGLTFGVTVTCAGGFGTADRSHVITSSISAASPTLIDGLPIGTDCVVVEDADDRFTATYVPAHPGAGAQTAVPTGGASVSVINRTSQLELTKQTTAPTTHPIDTTGEFEFAITCQTSGGVVVHDGTHSVAVDTANGAGSIGSLDPGELPLMASGTLCTAEEINVPDGWTAETGPQTITVGSGNTFSFVNARQTGSLVLSNTVNGLPADADPDDYTFVVTIMCSGGGLPDGYMYEVTLKHGESVTVADLPIGTICKILQDPDARFAASLPTGTLEIIVGEVAEAEVVNNTGTINITKRATTRIGTTASLAATFTFDVECDNGYTEEHKVTTDADGLGSSTWPDLPLLATGTECEIVEQTEPGWNVQGSAEATVEIETGEAAEVSFANEFQFGSVGAQVNDRPFVPSGTVPTIPAPARPVAEPSPPPPSGPLALTGSSARRLATFALMLISVGFATAGFGRRRRDQLENDEIFE